jgi:ferredoxin/flavodoxin---NADP+ reductase
MDDILDLIIIGGGPVGLYANQYALKKRMKTCLIEKSNHLGGKLKSVYPENPIYDVGGLKSWRADKLIDSMISQTEKYEPSYNLGENIKEIKQENLIYSVKTDKSNYRTHAILIATGRGIFIPESLAILNEEETRKAGLMTDIGDGKSLIGKKVVVVGGSHETTGRALEAANYALNVLIINWRFMESFSSLEGSRGIPSNMDILEPFGLLEILGDKKVTGIKVFHVDTDEERTVEIEAIIMARGYLENLNDLEKFGVIVQRNGISVKSNMHTSKTGIFSAGDAVYYPGKRRLISTGTDEAAKAVESAEKYIQAIWGNTN